MNKEMAKLVGHNVRCTPCGLGGKEIPFEHFIDHMPKLPQCPVCREAKMQKKGHHKTKEVDKDPFKEPRSFGDNVVMDNANILNPKQASRHKDTTLCVMMDCGQDGMVRTPPLTDKLAQSYKTYSIPPDVVKR